MFQAFGLVEMKTRTKVMQTYKSLIYSLSENQY